MAQMSLSAEKKQTHGLGGQACGCQGGGGGSGMDWKFGVSRCKLLHLKWISNEVLLYSTGNYIQSHVWRNITRWKIIWEKENTCAWLGLPEHCKSAIIKNFEKEKEHPSSCCGTRGSLECWMRSDLIPGLGTSICCRAAKKGKKKNKNNEATNRKYLIGWAMESTLFRVWRRKVGLAFGDRLTGQTALLVTRGIYGGMKLSTLWFADLAPAPEWLHLGPRDLLQHCTR